MNYDILKEYIFLVILIIGLFAVFTILRTLEKTWLLQPLVGASPTGKDIWIWWEKRRLVYNVFAFTTLIFSVLGWLFFFLHACPPGADFLSLMTVPFVPLGWNIAYCFGPLVDIIIFKVSGKLNSLHLLKLGICFSFIVITFPMVIWAAIWIGKTF